ncbi:class I SAM-dependent methyltransferase [Chromobacterium violaceum]|uniref:class I SAM-dependent methyltransferase n=1 Tax=Chromobacterium violaceum TaxID=536 RepID=UPI0035A5C13F
MLAIENTRLNKNRPHQCEICRKQKLDSFGSKDFGHAGNDHFSGDRTFHDYGVLVPYMKCINCGFIFTNLFDYWEPSNFIKHIYNEEYRLADPPFILERPLHNAEIIHEIFNYTPHLRTIIDIGGGDGQLAHFLRDHGVDSYSYDPHFGEVDTFPSEKTFDVITSFEVIEHVPHNQQRKWMKQLVNFMHHDKISIAIISTQTTKSSYDINWWYICPRNGHISIHSQNSLAYLAAHYGLNTIQLPNSFILLYKAKWEKEINDYAVLKILKSSIDSKSCAVD